MGRRLNLSHLSQEECERILAVIQRDLELRARERERLGLVIPNRYLFSILPGRFIYCSHQSSRNSVSE
ncbi:hypothetical protein HPB48_019367 [Haemaphysalis longicornis]|uniref:RabBD domain-containing protein n=1 Tax=Haemaphysalis longicornis TaxID=44386 RepID=A0A9J6FVN4_HAELO|nr:hypothetical protein HPB48_019367 [Haemaphysalis longicornis]